MNNKRREEKLRSIAERISSLEKSLNETNEDEVQAEIYQIASSLNIDDLCWVDEYIQKNHLI